MKKKKLLLGLLALLAIVFVFKGCPPPPSGEFARTSLSYTVDEDKPEAIKAYLDASGSMNGYFSKGSDGRYPSAIANAYAADIHWLDDDLTKVEGIISYNLLQSTFKGAATTFSDMFQRIWNDALKNEDDSLNNNLALLYTDGIISTSSVYTSKDPEVTKKSLVQYRNDITRFFENKNAAVAIFKLDSRFVGTYYDYTNNDDTNNKGKGKNTHGVDIKDRPFFVIAIGKPSFVRYFLNNNKLGAKLTAQYGIYDLNDTTDSCFVFSPTSLSDFDGNRLKTNIVSFSAPLPNYISKLGKHYCDSNSVVVLNGDTITKCVTMSFNDLAENVTISFDASKENAPVLLDECRLEFIVFKKDTPIWDELNSYDDRNIDKEAKEKKRTFGLNFLLQGIKDGCEKEPLKIFATSISFKH